MIHIKVFQADRKINSGKNWLRVLVYAKSKKKLIQII